MRHSVAGYKLGRNTAHRRATFRNMAAALFQHGQITTTLPKAKAVQPFVEKLITLARRGDLHSRRLAIADLQDRQLIKVVKGGAEAEEVEDKSLIQKLFDDIAPRYKDRPGGYTRIVRLGKHRIGDGADLVVLQLVDDETDEGPNVKGRYSRRRQKQDNRTAFAAKLRKAPGSKDEPAAEEAPAEEPAAETTEETVTEAAETAEASAEATAETPTEEAADDSNKTE